jgi:hypothetical protein
MDRREGVREFWPAWTVLRGMGSVTLLLGLALCHASCSDDVPGDGAIALPSDPSPLERGLAADGVSSETFADGPQSDASPAAAPTGTLSLMGHVSGAGDMASQHFRLRLSVGSPVRTSVLKSPSYQLQLLAPWTSYSEETP